jgi:uncharacterized protein (TIGR03546 family)
LAFSLFSLFAFVFDPVFHHLGYILLVQTDALSGLWTALYNAPIAPLTRFNNTVVLGSLLTAVILSFPVYFSMSRFVIAYRTTLGARMEQWKIFQILSKNFIVRWYLKIRDLGV